MKEFEGTVILPAQQLYQLIETAVETALSRQHTTATTTTIASDTMSAEEAARELKYKTTRTLAKYHYNELTPIRRGRRLFYSTDEVMMLKSKLFNTL